MKEERPNTPMMKQYFEIKDNYPDCILFYRLGDFYEMFFEDAITVSKELELTLTGRECGMEKRAPMCGVPFHAADTYITKLMNRGYKVAICEQVEDPSLAKGLVKRDVIKIITAGTTTNMETLEADKPNYLMALYYQNNCFGIACADILTGDFFVNEVFELSQLYDEVSAYAPSEIICSETVIFGGFDKTEACFNEVSISVLNSEYFDYDRAVSALFEQQKVSSLEGLGISDCSIAAAAAGAVVLYLRHTQRVFDLSLSAVHSVKKSDFMIIDDFSRRNLELTYSLIDNSKRGSLLWVLDKTQTAMGARKLRSFIAAPLYDKDKIIERQDLVFEMTANRVLLDLIRSDLSKIYDLDRLMGKILYHNANPKDMLSFRNSLEFLPNIKAYKDKLEQNSKLYHLLNELDTLEEVYQELLLSIDDEAGISARDGNIIKSGYKKEIDELREASVNGTKWLSDMEASEREKTGIKNLKIKFNRIFGYCIEVTNSYSHLIPDYYIRRQTMANAERYVTDELNRTGELILGSRDKLLNLEYHTFLEIREKIAKFDKRLRKTTEILSLIDVYASFAHLAVHNRYVKPKINTNGVLSITDGRHPVVERMLKTNSFISNHTLLDRNENLISVITGPNMAGKSTYMRQVALIVLMAHLGCFVPATAADIALTDRIFTRVGASDDLASGKSTFMVEMTEVAHILKNATKNSLLILDEIGRGTGTIDGLSIAWAVVEYVSNKDCIGAKTLFATHYHELSELEGRLSGVRNYNIAVKEQGESIVFLRKILRGGVDKSYGIQVAKLAGVPDVVINRASELLSQLKNNDLMEKIKFIDIQGGCGNNGNGAYKTEIVEEEGKATEPMQLGLFDEERADYSEIINELKQVSVESITPMEAMNILYQLRNKCR